jgi:uncharacterized OsmC-like protein
MTVQVTPVSNGVNVDALLQARDAMTAMPEAAAFTWRANCQWVNGVHSRTTIEKFFGVGSEQSHTRPFTLDTDHPPVFAAEDNGVAPIEMAMAALAGCLTAGIASVAQNRGVKLHSVTATVEGDMDLRGVLGIDSDVRNGFSHLRVRYEIDADATPEALRAVVAQSQKRSAVFDIVTNPTTVQVALA